MLEKDRSTPENESLEFCDSCQYLKEPDNLVEIDNKKVCPECEPTETLLSKIKTFGYDSFICTLSFNKGIYKLPLDLNNLESIPANRFGVSFDEFIDLLYGFKQSPEADFTDIFEEETTIFKLKKT